MLLQGGENATIDSAEQRINLTCLSTGLWSPVPVGCYFVQCKIPTYENISVSVGETLRLHPSFEPDIVGLGSILEYSCLHYGYEFDFGTGIESFTIECTKEYVSCSQIESCKFIPGVGTHQKRIFVSWVHWAHVLFHSL